VNGHLAATSGKENTGHECPECVPEEEPVAPMLLMGLGGMLIFFSMGFGLAAISGLIGFLIASVILFVAGMTMVMVGYRMNKKFKEQKHRMMHVKLENAKCAYCGTQNEPGARRCEFCDAPLKE
jgi:hypothetical protein